MKCYICSREECICGLQAELRFKKPEKETDQRIETKTWIKKKQQTGL